MPLLKKAQYRYQYNQFTMWESIEKLLDQDDPLAQKAHEQYQKELVLLQDPSVFTGTSDIYDADGVLHENVSNQDIMMNNAGIDYLNPDRDAAQLNTNDPGYLEYQKNALDLVTEIRDKYKDKPNNESLNVFLDIIETNKKSVMGEHHGFESSPAQNLISSTRKMMDVVMDFGGDDNGSIIADPAQTRGALNHFGLDKLFNNYNEIAKIGVEYNDEWGTGEPDPEKLKQIQAKTTEAADKFEDSVFSFRDKFYEDMKNPEEQRQIYKVTKKSNVDIQDVIGNGDRAIDYNFPSDRERFERLSENELLAAELMKAKRDNGHEKNTRFKQKTEALINDLLEERNGSPEEFTNEQRVDRLFDLREFALHHKKDPMAKAVLDIVNTHLANKINSKTIQDMETRADMLEQTDEKTEVRNVQNEPNFSLASLENFEQKKNESEQEFQERFEQTKQQATDALATKITQTMINRFAKNSFDNKEERQNYLNEHMKPENIAQLTEQIKDREDFKRMMKDVTDSESLSALSEFGKKHGGNKLIAKLSDYTKQVNKENEIQTRVQMRREKQVQKDNPEIALK